MYTLTLHTLFPPMFHSQVGWWFGISGDGKNPHGHIIRISAENGRYLARSYSPW